MNQAIFVLTTAPVDHEVLRDLAPDDFLEAPRLFLTLAAARAVAEADSRQTYDEYADPEESEYEPLEWAPYLALSGDPVSRAVNEAFQVAYQITVVTPV